MSLTAIALHSDAMAEFGEFILVRAAKCGMNQEVLIQRSGLSRQTIVNMTSLQRPEDSRAQVPKKTTLAETLRFQTWDDLVAAWRENDVMRDLSKNTYVADATNISRPLSDGGTIAVSNQPKKWDWVPILGAVVGGELANFALESEEFEGRPVVRLATNGERRFALILRGDSMMDSFQPGWLLVFRTMDAAEQFIWGKPYAIQLDGSGDGHATFKLIFPDPKSNDHILARAVNKTFRPYEQRIPAASIIRRGHLREIIIPDKP